MEADSASSDTSPSYKKYLDRDKPNADVPERTRYRKKKKLRKRKIVQKCDSSSQNDNSGIHPTTVENLAMESTSSTVIGPEATHPKVLCKRMETDLATSAVLYDSQINCSEEINQRQLERIAGPPETAATEESTRNDIDVISILQFLDTDTSTTHIGDSSPTNNDEDCNIHSTFANMLLQNNYTERVEVPVAATRGEIISMILKFGLINNLSYAAVKNLFHLINSIFAESILPDTRYLVDKLCSPLNDVNFFFTCHECKSVVRFENKKRDEEPIKCSSCETVFTKRFVQSSNCFVLWDISDDIRDIIEENADYYNFIVRERQSEPDVITDINDSKKYKQFLNTLNDHDRRNYVTMIFNSDGSPLFQSSALSIWPFQAMCNEVPIDVRLKSTKVCGLWFGKNKPDMQLFLKPIVENFNSMTETGIQCEVLGEKRLIRPYALCCCVDSQARAPMQGLVQYNGYSGCNWCLHPGEYVRENNAMKYPILCNVPENRTQSRVLDDIKKACEKNVVVNGFKCDSPLNRLKNFDIVEGFTVDYMHNSLLGVCKQFSDYWFVVRKEKYSLSAKQISEIDKLLSEFKPHTQVGRLSRPMKYRRYWKAKEWENWMLHYSIPVLSVFLDKKYFDHWQKFVGAMYILLKTRILKEDLIRANDLLHEFVYDTQLLYDKKAMTYNVHQLVHLVPSVINWGPLWAHSGFPFENGNGELLKSVHAASGIGHQIIRQLRFKKTCQTIMKKDVKSHRVLNFMANIYKQKTLKTMKTDTIRYIGVSYVPKTELSQLVEMSLKDTLAYDKIIKDKVMYSTDAKQNLRSDNSFALLSDGRFVRCHKFFIDSKTKTEKAIVNVLETTTHFENYTVIRKISSENNNKTVIETNDIMLPCNILHVKDKNYISSIPNNIHF